MKTEYEKKQVLEETLWEFSTKSPFYAAMMTSMSISFSNQVPTAGLVYTKNKEFKTYLNPEFFIDHLTREQRVAILEHEIMHFTHNHTFRFPMKDGKPPADFLLHNIAADMAINQYIQNLPKEAVDYKKFKLANGNTFPERQSYETYYELLKDEKNQEKNKDQMSKYEPIDEHGFMEAQMSEDDLQEMMQEAKKVIQRTMDKTSTSWDQLPEGIRDMIQKIDGSNVKLNAKRILQQCIKKSVSAQDRKHTWTRPSKRYDIYSQGTKNAEVPKINFYFDTSGSISIKEQNDFLSVMDKFLEAGSKKCTLGFWHTNLYKKKTYKRGDNISQEEIESGGTDVSAALQDIQKTNPNLAIILTDGYFDNNFQLKNYNDILWVISKGGNKTHPYFGKGKTILLENLI